MIFNKIVHNIGFEKTIQFILDDKYYIKNESVFKNYKKINDYITNTENNSRIVSLIKLFKKQRFFKVLKILKNKILNNYDKK